MIVYIVREMLRHLVLRLALSATFVVLRQKKPVTEYNVKLIKVKERDILVSAALLGISFAILTIWLVVVIKGGSSALIVAAGVLLSIGLSQQIMSIGIDAMTMSLNAFLSAWNSVLYVLSKQRTSLEWRFIESEVNQVFIYPQIVYVLPRELGEPKIASARVIRYITDHKSEVEYPHKIQNEEPSLLSFAEYSTEYIKDRLQVYNRLSNIQQRTGAINPVVFVALGTLIWLLS
ncbi:MAG: hypothetical protein ACE5J2_01320 [Nitrososphaerales archaeon]